SARYCASVNGGSPDASSRSIRWAARGATPASASAWLAGLATVLLRASVAEGLHDHVEDDHEHERDVGPSDQEDPLQARLRLRRVGSELGRDRVQPLRFRAEEQDPGGRGGGPGDQAEDDPELVVADAAVGGHRKPE